MRGARLRLCVCVITACSDVASALPESSIAVVAGGTIRVSALSPTLVRVEGVREDAGLTGFEDRPTFMVVNRSWGGVPVTVMEDDTYTTVATAYYAIRITKAPPPPPPGPAAACSVLEGAGLNGFQRSPTYCNGTVVVDVGGCCKACAEDRACVAYMFVRSKSPPLSNR